MRTAAVAVVWILLGQSVFAGDLKLSGRSKFQFFTCDDPQVSACIAFTEAQKKTCKCSKWVPRLFDLDLDVELDAERYLHKVLGAKKGSQVFADYLAQLTGKKESAPTFKEIRKNPAKHGYALVPREVPLQPGMFVVYENFGVVVASPGPTANEALVAYSSNELDGDLNVEMLKHVAPKKEGAPVVLAKKSLLSITEPVYWNAWTRDEMGGPTTLVLRPNTSYALHLDLAAVNYGRDTVAASAASANALEEITKWLQGPAASLDLDLVLVADEHFVGQSLRKGRVTLDLARMRNWYGGAKTPIPPDPLIEAASSVKPGFVFSDAKPFVIRTKKDAKGMASLTFTMWKEIPVDELTFSICVASYEEELAVCKAPRVLSRGFSAVPEMKASLPVVPEVAVTFVAPDRDKPAFGILRDNRPGAESLFTQWELKKSVKELRDYVAVTLENAFSSNIPLAGLAVFKELFATDAAQDAFRQAVEARLRQPVPVHDQLFTLPPRLHFRIIEAGEPAILPVSFITIPLKTDGGVPDLIPIGFHYVLDMPFGDRDTAPPADCITRWMLLYPAYDSAATWDDEKDVVKKAAMRAKNTLATWSDTMKMPPFPRSSMEKFALWLQDGKEKDGAALVMLAHHAANKMWFAKNEEITASLVGRSFTPPAVAILNGCGTGGSAANDFAKRLALNNVHALIVTSTDVQPDLAGDYLNMLAEELKADQLKEGFDLAHAHFHTLLRLRMMDNANNTAKYGDRALSFMLAGDGRLRLCAPQ